MFSLDDLQSAIQQQRIRITHHAKEEMWQDNVGPTDVIYSVLQGQAEIIESYPEPQGRPFPMALVLGRLPDGSLLHSVWAYDAATELAILVTVYRPDPSRWDPRFRKRR